LVVAFLKFNIDDLNKVFTNNGNEVLKYLVKAVQKENFQHLIWVFLCFNFADLNTMLITTENRIKLSDRKKLEQLVIVPVGVLNGRYAGHNLDNLNTLLITTENGISDFLVVAAREENHQPLI
jgi:hypothetical protein